MNCQPAAPARDSVTRQGVLRLIPTPSFASVRVRFILTAASAPDLSRSSPMPQPIPLPVRQHILALAHKGLDGAAIGRQLGLSPRTVQHLIRRFERGGPATCRPSYPTAACPAPPA